MSDDASCPSAAYFGDPVQPIVGDRTFHQIARYVTAGCTVVSVILCFGISTAHLLTYRDRREQRQIARIVLTPAIVCLFEFIGVVAYDTSGFLRPIGEYYDAVVLGSLFMLFITYATPVEQRGSARDMYNNLPNTYAQHAYVQAKGNELSQYYRCWFSVFQIIPVRFVLMIASMAVYGTVCKQLEDGNRANTVVTAITTVSTVICFLSVIRMMRFVKPSLQGHSPVMKTVALKGLIAFTVLFNLVWAILKETNTIHATSTMDKRDWFIGLPGMITCAVAVIFSILIVIPYRTSPYTAKAMPNARKHNYFVALFDVWNITDLLMATLSMFSAFSAWRNPPEAGAVNGYPKNQYGQPLHQNEQSPPPPMYGQQPQYGQPTQYGEEYPMVGR